MQTLWNKQQKKSLNKKASYNRIVFNLNNISGPPVEVGVTMYVLSISSVSEVLMVHLIIKDFKLHINIILV